MQPIDKYWYLHVARATDLHGLHRVIYRALEMLPGILSITTLALFVYFAFAHPVIAAYFTIAFSIYWLFKTIYLSLYLWHSHRRMHAHMHADWNEKLQGLPYEEVFHLVIFPFYKEGYEVLNASVKSLRDSFWDKKRIAVVLAAEARAGGDAQEIAERIRNEYAADFLDIIITVHPADLPGEIAGKGANAAFAAEGACIRILDAHSISYEQTIVSCFDSDTVVYPHYFGVLTWHFLTTEDPQFSSYQPAPLYNNNIWEAPVLSRVMAYSSSFWQMVQQERPEMLVTFSSHAMPFKVLRDSGYWQRNVVSEDSRIFFNLFVRNDGRYHVVPLAYPVSMDANVASSFWGTIKNIYKQHLRWSYGVESIPYLLFAFAHNPHIPFWKKMWVSSIQLEGFWSMVTHPLILFFIGWLPLLVGGRGFNTTILSYSLPHVAQGFLTAAMFGLILSAIFSMQLLPSRPAHYTRWRSFQLLLQWVLVPITMVIFSAIPGLDAQMRLLFGRYMGFWVTPKERIKGSGV